MKRLLFLGGAALVLLAWIWLANFADEPVKSDAALYGWPPAEQVARGAYLARVGNCMTCHTERGGQPYAGGRAMATPFGTVYAGNLTPDIETGLGLWTPGHFWRALHNGRSRDGRLLYPAFPYTHFTQVSREDSDALFAYLRSVPPVRQPNRPHQLRWPYSSQAALAVWRWLYFRPEAYEENPGRTAQWNRGAYLVRGLGHCGACHTTRNALGASQLLDLSGGVLPMQNWYAPSLNSPSEAGVASWRVDDIEELLGTGATARATVMGPMAEVVQHSTQHLSREDLQAMAVFLKSLPTVPGPAETNPLVVQVAQGELRERGERLYARNCASCHGEQGEGVPKAYVPLAGNRAVTLPDTHNLIQAVLYGGYAPATAGNPRPFGMPPFALELSDADIAAVLSYIRGAWGNRGAPVSELDVSRLRGSGQ